MTINNKGKFNHTIYSNYLSINMDELREKLDKIKLDPNPFQFFYQENERKSDIPKVTPTHNPNLFGYANMERVYDLDEDVTLKNKLREEIIGQLAVIDKMTGPIKKLPALIKDVNEVRNLVEPKVVQIGQEKPFRINPNNDIPATVLTEAKNKLQRYINVTPPRAVPVNPKHKGKLDFIYQTSRISDKDVLNVIEQPRVFLNELAHMLWDNVHKSVLRPSKPSVALMQTVKQFTDEVKRKNIPSTGATEIDRLIEKGSNLWIRITVEPEYLNKAYEKMKINLPKLYRVQQEYDFSNYKPTSEIGQLIKKVKNWKYLYILSQKNDFNTYVADPKDAEHRILLHLVQATSDLDEALAAEGLMSTASTSGYRTTSKHPARKRIPDKANTSTEPDFVMGLVQTQPDILNASIMDEMLHASTSGSFASKLHAHKYDDDKKTRKTHNDLYERMAKIGRHILFIINYVSVYAENNQTNTNHFEDKTVEWEEYAQSLIDKAKNKIVKEDYYIPFEVYENTIKNLSDKEGKIIERIWMLADEGSDASTSGYGKGDKRKIEAEFDFTKEEEEIVQENINNNNNNNNVGDLSESESKEVVEDIPMIILESVEESKEVKKDAPVIIIEPAKSVEEKNKPKKEKKVYFTPNVLEIEEEKEERLKNPLLLDELPPLFDKNNNTGVVLQRLDYYSDTDDLDLKYKIDEKDQITPENVTRRWQTMFRLPEYKNVFPDVLVANKLKRDLDWEKNQAIQFAGKTPTLKRLDFLIRSLPPLAKFESVLRNSYNRIQELNNSISTVKYLVVASKDPTQTQKIAKSINYTGEKLASVLYDDLIEMIKAQEMCEYWSREVPKLVTMMKESLILLIKSESNADNNEQIDNIRKQYRRLKLYDAYALWSEGDIPQEVDAELIDDLNAHLPDFGDLKLKNLIDKNYEADVGPKKTQRMINEFKNFSNPETGKLLADRLKLTNETYMENPDKDFPIWEQIYPVDVEMQMFPYSQMGYPMLRFWIPRQAEYMELGMDKYITKIKEKYGIFLNEQITVNLPQETQVMFIAAMTYNYWDDKYKAVLYLQRIWNNTIKNQAKKDAMVSEYKEIAFLVRTIEREMDHIKVFGIFNNKRISQEREFEPFDLSKINRYNLLLDRMQFANADIDSLYIRLGMFLLPHLQRFMKLETENPSKPININEKIFNINKQIAADEKYTDYTDEEKDALVLEKLVVQYQDFTYKDAMDIMSVIIDKSVELNRSINQLTLFNTNLLHRFNILVSEKQKMKQENEPIVKQEKIPALIRLIEDNRKLAILAVNGWNRLVIKNNNDLLKQIEDTFIEGKSVSSIEQEVLKSVVQQFNDLLVNVGQYKYIQTVFEGLLEIPVVNHLIKATEVNEYFNSIESPLYFSNSFAKGTRHGIRKHVAVNSDYNVFFKPEPFKRNTNIEFEVYKSGSQFRVSRLKLEEEISNSNMTYYKHIAFKKFLDEGRKYEKRLMKTEEIQPEEIKYKEPVVVINLTNVILTNQKKLAFKCVNEYDALKQYMKRLQHADDNKKKRGRKAKDPTKNLLKALGGSKYLKASFYTPEWKKSILNPMARFWFSGDVWFKKLLNFNQSCIIYIKEYESKFYKSKDLNEIQAYIQKWLDLDLEINKSMVIILTVILKEKAERNKHYLINKEKHLEAINKGLAVNKKMWSEYEEKYLKMLDKLEEIEKVLLTYDTIDNYANANILRYNEYLNAKYELFKQTNVYELTWVDIYELLIGHLQAYQDQYEKLLKDYAPTKKAVAYGPSLATNTEDQDEEEINEVNMISVTEDDYKADIFVWNAIVEIIDPSKVDLSMQLDKTLKIGHGPYKVIRETETAGEYALFDIQLDDIAPFVVRYDNLKLIANPELENFGFNPDEVEVTGTNESFSLPAVKTEQKDQPMVLVETEQKDQPMIPVINYQLIIQRLEREAEEAKRKAEQTLIENQYLKQQLTSNNNNNSQRSNANPLLTTVSPMQDYEPLKLNTTPTFYNNNNQYAAYSIPRSTTNNNNNNTAVELNESNLLAFLNSPIKKTFKDIRVAFNLTDLTTVDDLLSRLITENKIKKEGGGRYYTVIKSNASTEGIRDWFKGPPTAQQIQQTQQVQGQQAAQQLQQQLQQQQRQQVQQNQLTQLARMAQQGQSQQQAVHLSQQQQQLTQLQQQHQQHQWKAQQPVNQQLQAAQQQQLIQQHQAQAQQAQQKFQVQAQQQQQRQQQLQLQTQQTQQLQQQQIQLQQLAQRGHVLQPPQQYYQQPVRPVNYLNTVNWSNASQPQPQFQSYVGQPYRLNGKYISDLLERDY